MRHWQIAALALAVASPAAAGVQYSTYEGSDAVQTGTGGAKITKDGIDFWTEGTPPRRFQVLGILTDSRHDGSFSGNAIGSRGLAKRVREAGGDALIVMNQDSHIDGHAGGLFSNGFGGVRYVGKDLSKITTTFAVIRYLPSEQ